MQELVQSIQVLL